MNRKWFFVALAACLLLAVSALAQETTGTIYGQVTDPSGAAVANAKVIITNTDKNVVIRTVTTDGTGKYSAPLLPIGKYALEVEAGGFAKIKRTAIELNVSDRLTENFSLQVGSGTETVNVEANPVQVELQSPTASGLISGVEVRQLSLNNRNYEQMVALMPGVSSSASDQIYIGTTNPAGQANTVTFSINGSRTAANNWTIDGADNVDRGSNLTLLNYPSIDAIAEFKVLRGLYSAEFGRGAGQINVVTRSGGAQYHGDAYEFWRNDALNANDYFRKRGTNVFNATHPSPLRYHDFGYTLGGPVPIGKKDHTFFFFSEEFRRNINYTTFAGVPVPTAQEKQGIFPVNICLSGYTAPVGTGQGSCTNQLAAGTPLATIDPVAAAYIKDIFNNLPNPDNPTTNLSTFSFRNVFNARQELIRIDHTLNDKWSLFGRYLQDAIPTQEPVGIFTTNSFLPGVSNSSTDSPGKSVVIRATDIVSSKVLLDFGYSYSYGGIKNQMNGYMNPANSPDVKAAVAGKLAYTPTLARIPSIVGFLASTNPNGTAVRLNGTGPYDEANKDHSVFGNVSWLQGRHNLKFGGTYHYYIKTENAAGDNASTFNFNSTGAAAFYAGSTAAATKAIYNNAQTFANFLMGKASSFSQAAADITPFIRLNQFEFYGQDEFRWTPRLTLSFGLRYSYFPQPYNTNSALLSNFDPTQYKAANAPLINATTGNIVVNAQNQPTQGDPLNGIIFGNGALKNSPYGNAVGLTAKANFAPRFGLSWDPTGSGKTAIRTGWGMFYQSTLTGTYEQAMFANPPYAATISITNPAVSTSDASLKPNFLSGPTAAVPSVSASPKTLRGVQTTGDTPYTQSWSLDVQHQFGKATIVDVGYYGSADKNLLGIIDINQPLPGAYLTAGLPGVSTTTPFPSSKNAQLNAIRPFLGYGPINTIRPWFSGNYNSMQLSVEHRFSGDSVVKFNYTWSKALTNNQTDRSSAPQNSYDINAEYGLSALDRRHIVTATYVYELPWYRSQQGWKGHLLGGWQTSGIITINSGLPLTVTNSSALVPRDPAGQGCTLAATVCSVRPNQIAGSEGPQTLTTWFNTAAFVENTTLGVPGNARRGSIIGPGLWRADASIFKVIKIKERFQTQLRLEGFNIFNHENFNGVNTTFGSSAFGNITSSRDPRIVQLAAKFSF